MSRKKIIGFIISGAVIAAAAIGLVSYQAVYAQTAAPTQPAPNTGTQQVAPNNGVGRGFGPRRGFGYNQQDLATALGITTTQLQTAEQSANTNALNQLVAKGVITQSQADQLASRGYNSAARLSQANGIDYNALLAQALNISASQLQTAKQKALTTALNTAVANGNLTQAQADLIAGREALANNSAFQTAMSDAYKAAIQQALSSGVITQAQANALLAQQSQNGGFFGGGFRRGGLGGFGKHGGFFGRNGNNGGNNGTPASPTATPSLSGSGL